MRLLRALVAPQRLSLRERALAHTELLCEHARLVLTRRIGYQLLENPDISKAENRDKRQSVLDLIVEPVHRYGKAMVSGVSTVRAMPCACHLCGWIERIPGGTRQNDGQETA